jgi:hypothetical protein
MVGWSPDMKKRCPAIGLSDILAPLGSKRSHYVAPRPRNLSADRSRDRSRCDPAERLLDAFERWPAWAMGRGGCRRHDRSRDAVAGQPFAPADMRQDA